MRFRRVIELILVFAIAVNIVYSPAMATDMERPVAGLQAGVDRASGKFSMTISPGKLRRADSSFPLEAGEIVTINASFSPRTASVDFGLIDENDVFHYINVTNGSINEQIQVKTRGEYTLAIRNHSENELDVSGYVNY